MEDGGNELLFSVASSWEIAIKYAVGKLALPEPPPDFVPPRLRRDRISTLHIEHRHALHLASLPMHHRDPFDRILIAQAQLEGVPIITADHRFHRYDVEILWEGGGV
jgi:PIN domain nuclease of toxin-antitoxin system